MTWWIPGAADGSIQRADDADQYDLLSSRIVSSFDTFCLTLSVGGIFISYFWSLFPSTKDYYFEIVLFPIDEFFHWKVVSYQFEYTVHK